MTSKILSWKQFVDQFNFMGFVTFNGVVIKDSAQLPTQGVYEAWMTAERAVEAAEFQRLSGEKIAGQAVRQDDAPLDADGLAYDGTNQRWKPVKRAIASVNSFLRTAAGNTTLLPAADEARVVKITVKVVTVFAAGDGAAPIFDFGETDTPEKFAANLTTGAAGAVLIYMGTLSAGKALLAGATAATGTTSTGAIDVFAEVFPTA